MRRLSNYPLAQIVLTELSLDIGQGTRWYSPRLGGAVSGREMKRRLGSPATRRSGGYGSPRERRSERPRNELQGWVGISTYPPQAESLKDVKGPSRRSRGLLRRLSTCREGGNCFGVTLGAERGELNTSCTSHENCPRDRMQDTRSRNAI